MLLSKAQADLLLAAAQASLKGGSAAVWEKNRANLRKAVAAIKSGRESIEFGPGGTWEFLGHDGKSFTVPADKLPWRPLKYHQPVTAEGGA